MKLIALFFLLFSISGAVKVQISADSFERNQQKKISTFRGHVNIKTQKDELNASKVLVYVDDKNHPLKYIATGKVQFKITTDVNSSYEGRSEKLTFLPLKSEYRFEEDVFIKDIKTSRTLSGDNIHINVKTGNAKILARENVPVRVTFDIGDDNKSNEVKGLNNMLSKPADIPATDKEK